RSIALAHTRDDQAETVLLRLLRGAGGSGLSAMRALSGDLLRPMLALTRRDVLDHLSARGLAWREDPTNADLSIARNRVRHELIPYLERHFNPSVRDALARSAAVLAEEADVLAAVAGDARRAHGHKEGDGYVLPLDALRKAPRALARPPPGPPPRPAGARRGAAPTRGAAVGARPPPGPPPGGRAPPPGPRGPVSPSAGRGVAPRHEPGPEFALPLSVPGEV